MLYSSSFEKPVISGNSVTLPIVRVGTKAYDKDGKAYILTRDALSSSGDSWAGGIVTINHMVREKGKIASSWFEEPFVYATVEKLSPETVDAINSAAYRGVSQESNPLEVKGNNVQKLKGTGVSFVFYPLKAACPLKNGCGVPIKSALMDSEEERLDFDIATMNNAGRLIKVKEISVFLWGEERDNEDVLKTRLMQESVFIGRGQYSIFNRDSSLSLGDEIPEGQVPVHTVNIAVSSSCINFPLNSTPEKSDVSTLGGGITISDEKNIDELKSTISALKAENAKLKSTNDELQTKLKESDTKIESTVKAAVKAAIESHDLALKENSERDSVISELKSCIPEAAMKELLSSEPSTAVLKSTIAALKASAGKHVGTSSGGSSSSLQSTKDERSIYRELGVTSIEVEEGE